ncbi:hypothetical protein B296_00028578 [Ensete ventricosum]|uniref:Uncharacterized protein n=1 Tax=Ensete ventricosum TaxID=4639 RepID=A0A426ZMP2_ENSVE|nr:hypothetical protein B296_00028578 [Ensete ventricosum]
MWQLGGRRLLAPAVGLRTASTAAVSSCRAVMLPRFGGPEVLEVRPAVGVPSLKPRDLLVRSRAVSINPLDLRVIRKLLWRKRATITMGYWWTYMRADAEGLDEIRRLSEAGKLKIPVEKTFPIAEVRKAHEVKEKRIIPGKVVLEVDCNTTPEAHLCSK